MSTNENSSKQSFARGEITVEPIAKSVWIDEISLLMPAGRYFVGDPCYTAGIDDNAWQKWCKVVDKSGNDEVLAATYNGLPVVGLHTAYGDGQYFDESGGSYGVDAGLIGAVPAQLIEAMEITEDDLKHAGYWIDFEEAFAMRRNPDGLLEIGHVQIQTGDSYDADEEDDSFIQDDSDYDLDAEEDAEDDLDVEDD